MPRYFFDTDDGDRAQADEVGLILSDDEAARFAAVSALPDMIRDTSPDRDRRDFTVTVRDERGTVVYSACLALTGAWLRGRPA